MSFTAFSAVPVILSVLLHLANILSRSKNKSFFAEILRSLSWTAIICFGYSLTDRLWASKYSYFDDFYLWCIYSFLVAMAINFLITLFVYKVLR